MSLPCLNVLPHHIEDATSSVTIQEIWAQLLKEEKRRRRIKGDAVERSRLSYVCGWAGNEGRPVCNVWLNILQVQGKSEEMEKDDIGTASGDEITEQKAEKDYSGRLLRSLKVRHCPGILL